MVVSMDGSNWLKHRGNEVVTLVWLIILTALIYTIPIAVNVFAQDIKYSPSWRKKVIKDDMDAEGGYIDYEIESEWYKAKAPEDDALRKMQGLEENQFGDEYEENEPNIED